MKTEVVLKYFKTFHSWNTICCLMKTEVVLKLIYHFLLFRHWRVFNENRSCIEISISDAVIVGLFCLMKTEVVLKYIIEIEQSSMDLV